MKSGSSLRSTRQQLLSRWWLAAATAVLLLAAVLRLILLSDVPPGLAQDEILDADIALFIRQGEHALFFSHGYGHEPLYHYLAAPFAPLFGDNALAIRLPSVYLGLLLVALTMAWARREFGALTAVVAGAGLAISWWPIIFSRIGIRPILEPVLLMLAVWFWPLRATSLTPRHGRSAALAGLFLGLSIYSYTAARIILLIPALMLLILGVQYLWTGRGDPERRPMLRAQLTYVAVILLAGLLVYLPLGLTLRANPDLQQRLEQLEGPLDALRQGDVGPVLEMTAATLGVFSVTGDPRWTYTLPDRPLFDPLTAVLFYGGLLLALWRWRRPSYLLLPVWLLVALLPSAFSPDAPSTVRLVGALPVIYLLPGLAVGWVAARLMSRRRGLAPALVALLLGLVLLNGYRTVRDGFVRWPQDVETRLRYQTAIRDIGRYWRASGDSPPVVAEVFYEPIDGDSLRRSIGADPAARWIQTGAGVAGALVWPGGRPARLFVPEYAPLDTRLMTLAGMDVAPSYRSDASPSFAVYELPALSTNDSESHEITFGGSGELTLIGVTPPRQQDGHIELATLWRVGAELPADLAIFVHLQNDGGELVSQFDGLDAAPGTLRPGDVFLQRHLLVAPEDEAVTLRLGLYRRVDGQRLMTADGRDVVVIGACGRAVDGAPSAPCSLTESH